VELREGAWDGHDCYIVGGGKSLKAFNFDSLTRKRHVIVINRAFIDVPTADIWFTEDARVITDLWGQRLKHFRGLKVWNCLQPSEIELVKAVDPSIEIIQTTRKDKFWSRKFSDGLGYSSNSGVGAMNIAWLLGADRIFLLGFDCRTDGLRMENYHQDYKHDPMWEVGSNAADNFLSDFTGWVQPHVKDREVINVINSAHPSALTCWKTMPYQEFYAL
jgi:hypothetical protein